MLFKPSFDTWMFHVDKALAKLCNLESDDLPDWDYMVAYEDERTDFDQIAWEVVNDSGYGHLI